MIGWPIYRTSNAQGLSQHLRAFHISENGEQEESSHGEQGPAFGQNGLRSIRRICPHLSMEG